MQKLIKWVFIVVAVLVVIAVAVPFLLPLETYKQEIAAQVKKATGRDLVIGGAIKASLFPTVGIKVENASLSNPPGFSKEQMLQVESLVLDVELMPLFSKQIRIKRFVLAKPIIDLEVNASGKPNWEFAAPDAPEASAEAKATSDKKADTVLAGLVLGDVRISDGTVSYRDAQKKSSFALSQVNLKTALSSVSKPFSAEGEALWNDEKATITFTLDSPAEFLSGKPAEFAFNLKAAPIALHYLGKATQLNANGTMRLEVPSLPKLAKWTGGGFEWKGSTPLKLDVEGSLNCGLGGCTLKDGAIALDDIKATGNLRASFAGKPQIEATLEAGALDLNPYLPKKQASNDWFITPAFAMEPWSNERIDLSALNAVNATINITTGSVLYDKIKLGKTTMTLTLVNGALRHSIPKAEFYGGSITTNSTLDASGAFSKQVTLSGVEAEPFLKDATDSDRLSGTLNMTGNFSGRLTSMRGAVESLGGSGSVKLTDGAVKGVDLAGMIRNIQSAYKNVDTSQQKTDFAELGGTFTIARGIVSNNDLAMKAPLLRLKGQGTVDLPSQSINYRLTPEIVKTVQGQGGKEKQGLEVPILVSGPLDQPRFAPDLAGMAQKALENPEAIKETVKDVKTQLKENKGAIKDLLKGLKGQ